ncbi:RDD family protein [Streptomyces fagopyri]|uniref:RDD family protein n=1 Tax=Streptomyces fagopyri TaxID=2662397 RepID=UPI00368C7F53
MFFIATEARSPQTNCYELVVLIPVGFAVGGVVYFLPLVHWWGTTVGKRLFGLRVVRLWSDGTLPPSWRDTFVREFDRGAFLALPVLNLLVAAILLAQMFKDKGTYHQSKYDRAARTVVVRWPARSVTVPVARSDGWESASRSDLPTS